MSIKRKLALPLLWAFIGSVISLGGVLLFAVYFSEAKYDQEYQLIEVPEDLRELFGTEYIRKMTLGKWSCQSSHSVPGDLFICSYDGRIIFNAYSGAEWISLSISDKNTDHVNLKDKDKDGRYDELCYNGLSKDGKLIRILCDGNMDGTPDKVAVFPEELLRVRVDGKWSDVHSLGKDESGRHRYEILVDGVATHVFPYAYPYTEDHQKSNKQG